MMRYVLCFLLLMLAVNLTAVTSPFEKMAVDYTPMTISLHVKEVPVVHPVSVKLVNGELHVVWREPSKTVLMCNPPRPAPDRVWKEVYGAVDGAIVLLRTVRGEHVPASTRREQILFPEDE